jgi:hypothetical protein
MLAHPAKRIVPVSVAMKITMFEVRDVVITMTPPKSPLSAFVSPLAIFLFAARANG